MIPRSLLLLTSLHFILFGFEPVLSKLESSSPSIMTDSQFDSNRFSALEHDVITRDSILGATFEEDEDDQDPHPLRMKEWKIEVSHAIHFPPNSYWRPGRRLGIARSQPLLCSADHDVEAMEVCICPSSVEEERV